MSKIADVVFEFVKPYADSLGLEVVDVEYGKKVNGNNLTIFIDKKGGITIDDCEALHRLIDAPLDELNPTNDVPYILNVSSCGLDRPLKNVRDFLRNVGNKVNVKLYKPLNNKKLYQGIIESADDSVLNIKDNDGNLIAINIELIALVQLDIEI